MDIEIVQAIHEILFMVIPAGMEPMKLYILLGLGVLTLLLLYAKVGAMLSGVVTSVTVAAVSLVVSIGLMLLFSAVIKVYVVPHIPGPYAAWLLPGSGVIGVLLIALPLLARLNGFSYLVSLGAMFAAIAGAVLIMYLAGIGYDMAMNGKGSSRSRRGHKRDVDRVLSL